MDPEAACRWDMIVPGPYHCLTHKLVVGPVTSTSGCTAFFVRRQVYGTVTLAAMPDDTVRVLRCLVKGTTAPMKISISVNDDICDLKAKVHNMGKNRILRETDIPDLFIWKVRTTLRNGCFHSQSSWQLKKLESLEPEESLGDRIFSQLESQGHPTRSLSTIAKKLGSSARIGDVFKDQPELGLHIVVQFVASRECERLSIRRHRVSNFTATISPSLSLTSNISTHGKPPSSY